MTTTLMLYEKSSEHSYMIENNFKWRVVFKCARQP